MEFHRQHPPSLCSNMIDLVFQWKNNRYVFKLSLFPFYKTTVFFFLSNYKEEHAQILKFGKRRRGKRGKVIQNNFQGYLWLHLSICPSKLFPKYTHTNAHSSKMFSHCTTVACFFHLAGQCIFSSILIFLGTWFLVAAWHPHFIDVA